MQARQSEALEAVRAALVKRWPDCKVHLFGSTANELSICNNNDIDICLELPDLPNDLVGCPQPHLACSGLPDTLTLPLQTLHAC